MNPPSFQLIDSPWIPVRALEGVVRRVGTHEALLQAHELSAVEHPIPIIEAGLRRFLGAVVLDIFEPRSLDDLLDLLEGGRFDDASVTRYLDRHRAAFDLFSPTRPFLQDATADGSEKPVAALLPSVPSGTNVTHWHHGWEDDFAISPAEAAALLTSIAPFMTAGGAGLAPSVNGAPPWYALLDGRTLFHSLVYNLWVRHHADVKRGLPAWRRTQKLQVESRRTSTTLLEALTWQPRRVRLIPGAGGRCALSDEESPMLVRSMHFSAGESCDFVWTDPNVAYVHTPQKRFPLRPSADRDPWRDVGALALLQDQPDEASRERNSRVRPSIVSQFDELCRRAPGLVDGQLRLRLYGMRTDLKMKVFEMLAQPLELSVPLVLNELLHRKLVESVEEAEQVQRTLDRALRRAVTISAHDPSAARMALTRASQRMYWSGLEEHYRALADRLGMLDPSGDDARLQEVVADWRTQLSRVARRAYDDATRALRLNADRLAAIERGRALLDSSLARLGSPPAQAGESRPRRRARPR